MGGKTSIKVIKAKYLGHTEQAGVLLSIAAEAYSQAHNELPNIIKNTRTKLKIACSRIRKRAYQRGFKAGHNDFEASLATKLKEFQALRDDTICLAHRECLDLVMEIANEIVQAQLTVNPDSISNRVERALHNLIEVSQVSIQVNPAQAELLKRKLSQKCPDLRFQVDPQSTIKPGDLVLVTDAGTIELNWQSQLQALSQKLSTRLESMLASNQNVSSA